MRLTTPAQVAVEGWLHAVNALRKRLISDVKKTIFTQYSVFVPARTTDMRRDDAEKPINHCSFYVSLGLLLQIFDNFGYT